MRQCRKCKLLKPQTDFSKRTRRKDGINTICKQCSKEIYKKWWLENIDRKKAYDKKYNLEHPKERQLAKKRWYQANRERLLPETIIRTLKRRYGMTVEDKLAMRLAQNHKCAVCSITFKTPFDCNVDHDHKTGKIRELLCNRCNLWLGRIDDSVELLEKAIAYLLKHSPQPEISANPPT